MNYKQRLKHLKIFLQKKRFFWTGKYFIFSVAVTSYLGIAFYQNYKTNGQYLLLHEQTSAFNKYKIPVFLRNFLYSRHAKKYGVNVEELEKTLIQYETFSELRSSKIKPRPQISNNLKDLTTICCPCDSEIVQISKIVGNEKIKIKDVEYPIGSLVFSVPNQIKTQLSNVNQIKLDKQNELYLIVFNIHKGNYHRFHSPSKLSLKLHRQVEVKKDIRSMIFKRKAGGTLQHARTTIHCTYLNPQTKTKMYLGLVMVGSLDIKDIVIHDKKSFQKGEEIGYFSFGSSIAMIIQSKGVPHWNKKLGQNVKYGQNLCSFS